MKLAILAATAAAILTAGAAGATTYNVVADFDYTQPGGSTSGLFRYGYFDNAADTGFATFTSLAACGTGAAFGCARLPDVDSLGVTEYLPGGDVSSGTSQFRTGYVNLHSGPNGQQAAVAFTAAVAGTYSFDGRFQIHDGGYLGTASAAYNADKSVTYLPLAALTADGRDFSFSQLLGAGDTVLFVLDPAGAYFNDSTGFRLTVDDGLAAAVPEPATWAMLILGFGIVGAGMRRRAGIALAAA